MYALPLPAHATLGVVAEELARTQQVAEIWDAHWRVAYLTPDYLRSCGATAAAALPGIGAPVHGAATLSLRTSWPGFATTESWIASLTRLLPAIAHDLPGGVEQLRAEAAPELLPALDGLVPHAPPTVHVDEGRLKFGRRTSPFVSIGTRLRGADDRPAGTAFLVVPAASGAVLSLLATADHAALERLLAVVIPGRRPAAILYADLEGSSELARELPPDTYFRMVRRLMHRMDDAVVQRGGLVGKHAGDGMTALFIAEQYPSPSAAARAAVETAREIGAATAAVAEHSGLAAGAVRVRFGVHWGDALFIGGLLTSGRADVTALGEEMNEAARIEACATGERLLASEALVARLAPEDMAALDIAAPVLRRLADLDTATAKARRDAPDIAVCDLR